MIVITGGLGFIGNELARQLIRQNKPLAIVDNRNRVAPAIDDILVSAACYEIDIVDFPALDALFQVLKPEIVVHLAAIHFIPECNENPERTLRINVEGTSSIVRAAKHAGTKRIIFASSGAVYDDLSGMLTEESSILPVDIYGYSKLFGEGICRLNARADFEIVACRLFNNYGPRETNAHIIPEIMKQLRNGNDLLHLGNIKPIRDYIHTWDTAQAIMRIMTAELPNAFTPVNICTGTGYAVENLIGIISQLLNRDIRIEIDSNRLRKVDKMVQLGSFERLQKITGWEPKWEIAPGLRDLLVYEGIA